MLMVGFGLHYYAFKNGIADENDEVHTDSLKKQSDLEDDDYKTGNGFLDKWLEFGGGYYGCMALIKFIFLEIAEIGEFIADWQGLDNFINAIDIPMIVNFFVEQFLNFIFASIWPVNYLQEYSIYECAVFVGVTYLVYKATGKLARQKFNEIASSSPQ